MKNIIFLLILFSSLNIYGQKVFIRAGKMYDGSFGPIQTNQIIEIKDGKIIKTGPDLILPAGADVVDLKNQFVMPGLIDAHTHIVLHSGNYDDQILRETPEYRARQSEDELA